jgi:hypothetical protein
MVLSCSPWLALALQHWLCEEMAWRIFPYLSAAWLLPPDRTAHYNAMAGRLHRRVDERLSWRSRVGTSGCFSGDGIATLVTCIPGPVEKASRSARLIQLSWLFRFPGTLGLHGMFLYAGFSSRMFPKKKLVFSRCLQQCG